MSVSGALRYENLSFAGTCILSKHNFISEMCPQLCRVRNKKSVKR